MCDTFETSATAVGLIKQQLCSSLSMDDWKGLHSSSTNTQTVFFCLWRSRRVYRSVLSTAASQPVLLAITSSQQSGIFPVCNSEFRAQAVPLLKCVSFPKVYIWWCQLQPKMSSASLYHLTVLDSIYSATMHKTPETWLFAIPWSLIWASFSFPVSLPKILKFGSD